MFFSCLFELAFEIHQMKRMTLVLEVKNLVFNVWQYLLECASGKDKPSARESLDASAASLTQQCVNTGLVFWLCVTTAAFWGGKRKEGSTCSLSNRSLCFPTAVLKAIYYWKKCFFHPYRKTLGEFRLFIMSSNSIHLALLCFLW